MMSEALTMALVGLVLATAIPASGNAGGPGHEIEVTPLKITRAEHADNLFSVQYTVSVTNGGYDTLRNAVVQCRYLPAGSVEDIPFDSLKVNELAPDGVEVFNVQTFTTSEPVGMRCGLASD